MRRRLAVILMADMVDYTSAMESDQTGTIKLIRELRKKWLEPEAAKRGGDVLKRLGDGWIIAFSSVTDAVQTAQSVQSTLANHGKIRLRIAAHLGEIVEDEADIYGTGINITARLQTEAPPGGVMISEDLHRQLDEQFADGFIDAGAFDLKNIAKPVIGFQWRPTNERIVGHDEVPTIAVEQVKAAPQTRETNEAGADLQEQLVHNLSRRKGVLVLAADESGDAEATYSLNCRLRTRGDVARITSTLVRRSDGQVTWSRIFEGDSQDLFEVTDRAAEQLSDALRLQINAFDGERLINVPDDQLSASELRTRAAMLFYRATIADYLHAGNLLERALRLDPDNASGLAMWCEAQLYILEAGYRRADRETHARIIGSAHKAVQASPRSDYSWYIRAQIRARLDGDLDGARKDVERLIQLNPGYVLGMEALGYIELIAGNWEAACKPLADASARSTDDPFLPFRLYPLAAAYMLAGQPDLALTAISDATELRPSCQHFWLVKAWILRESGNHSQAAKAAELAERASGNADILAQNLHLPEEIREAIGLPSGPIET
ncbi:MAG: tetratricopeptide repeat protein [Rhizobiaceae bacterium]